MDDIDLLKMAGVSTSGLAIILLVYRVLKSIRGKKFVSSCCGKKMEMGMDIQEMTPVVNPLALKRQETTGLPETDKV